MALRNWTGALDDYLAHVSDLAVKQGANSAEVKKLIHTYTEPNSRERRLADSAVSLCAAWELEHGGRPREPTRLPPDMMNTGSPIRYVAAGAAAGIVFVLALGLSVIVPWHESSINEVKSSIEEAVAGKTATMRDALAAEQSRVRELEQRVVIAQSELQAEVKEARHGRSRRRSSACRSKSLRRFRRMPRTGSNCVVPCWETVRRHRSGRLAEARRDERRNTEHRCGWSSARQREPTRMCRVVRVEQRRTRWMGASRQPST